MCERCGVSTFSLLLKAFQSGSLWWFSCQREGTFSHFYTQYIWTRMSVSAQTELSATCEIVVFYISFILSVSLSLFSVSSCQCCPIWISAHVCEEDWRTCNRDLPTGRNRVYPCDHCRMLSLLSRWRIKLCREKKTTQSTRPTDKLDRCRT